MQEGQLALDFPEYLQFWHSAEKKGYSGTAIFTKKEPISVKYDFGDDIHDKEGRVITLEYSDFFVVNAYVPNAQRELGRLPYRMDWEKALQSHLSALNKEKPVIYCGDFNVAHQEIDLKNPKTNVGNAGFTKEEREKFTELLNLGFSDVYRSLYPDKIGYTWWSYMRQARERNIGWRIDYFVISNQLMDKVEKCDIYPEIYGSDHCPVSLEIDINY
jgi:exodeoxyribonuclease-3